MTRPPEKPESEWTEYSRRICNCCHTKKTESEFYHRSDEKIVGVCKACALADKKHHYREHRKEMVERQKRNRREHKKKIAENQKRYYREHKKEIIERKKLYCETHKLEIAEYRKRYRRTPKGQNARCRGRDHRRAKERGAFVEHVDRQDIYKRDGWICQICGKKVNPSLKYPDLKSASLDHIVPLSLDGKHERKNVQLMHLNCNKSKQARSVGCQLRVFG